MYKIVTVFAALACLGSAPLAIAQAQAERVQNTRIIAIGARRTATFERSTKSYKIEMEGPDGSTVEEVIPKGVPIEIAGKENEYVPYQLYTKNKGKGKSRLARFSLGLNSLSPNLSLSPREQLQLYKRRVIPAEGGGEPKYKLEAYAATPINPMASHSLVAIVKNYKEKEGWAKPLVKSFNTSPDSFGSGSCLVFNSSPFDMIIKFHGQKEVLLKPYKHKFFTGLTKDKYGAIPYDCVLKLGKKVERLPSNALVGDNSRHYIFTFIDPRKGVSRRADMTVFSERVPSIITPQ